MKAVKDRNKKVTINIIPEADNPSAECSNSMVLSPQITPKGSFMDHNFKSSELKQTVDSFDAEDGFTEKEVYVEVTSLEKTIDANKRQTQFSFGDPVIMQSTSGTASNSPEF